MKTIYLASGLSALGLVLTVLIQIWFNPITLALFFLLGVPLNLAGIGLYVYIVFRDAIKPKL
jgi:hypothetical protein